ncbi:receptor-like serine/threonine-protein kinase ALE2 [Solanum pennellii]|uniref:Receptor-like serine/threonine-protein kinase ALE2 n=1 Tax=Solanum pennellii TaxID=28526 RepID=A0ABM1H056_SOLPN|nr:receptor-like serine/threonine-protein kinase ALE2 [Solanum pennellii]
MNSKLGTRDLAIIYRVYYKLMKTTIAPKAINSSPKGVTMLVESNQEHSTTFVPRMLKWNDVLSDESLKFESITEPLPGQPSTSSLESILQFTDGSVNLKFLRSNSFGHDSSSRRILWLDLLLQGPERQENLVTWARPILRDKDRLEEVAHPRLEGKYPKEDFVGVRTIAAACVAPEASQRPTMGEVVQSLKMVQRVTEYQDTTTINSGARPNLR